LKLVNRPTLTICKVKDKFEKKKNIYIYILYVTASFDETHFDTEI